MDERPVSLFAELKRRNVFRAGAAYVALTWVVVQITGAIVPALNLPAAILPMVVWLGVIGFPCVLVFSWVYELTPEGLKREHEVDRSQSIIEYTGRRLDLITIGLVIAAVVLVLLDRFVIPHRAAENGRAQATLQQAQADRRTAGAGHARVTGADSSDAADDRAHGPPQQAVPDEHSIAVLPFVNMSSDKEQEFFSDGISEELLNLLARIPELKVIARTSSFAFKGEKVEVAEIARRLNVAHVLEGSVRKAGNTVRITAQLIRAADSTHLWSDTWDRPLDDVFAVQDEIAGAVVRQLKIKLLGAAPSARPIDPRVYPMILQAKALGDQGSADSMAAGIELYRQALAIVPEEPRAWSGLGRIYLNRLNSGIDTAEGGRLAREALEKALALDPDDALTHSRMGVLLSQRENDLPAAAAHCRRALVLDPGNVAVLGNAANFLQEIGRLEQSIPLAEHHARLDPANPTAQGNLFYAYYWAGRHEEAIALMRTALSISPGRSPEHSAIGVMQLLDGKAEQALAEMQLEANEAARLGGLAMAYHTLGRAAESEDALQQLIARHTNGQRGNIAMVYAWRGEPDLAFEWLGRAAENQESMGWVLVQPVLKPLHTDPRWQPFLRRIGRAPGQLAAIRFEVDFPQ